MLTERIKAKIADRDMRFTCLTALLFLFFFELLGEFVARVYALNLLSMSLNADAALLLLLLSPALLVCPAKCGSRHLAVTGALVVCCRLLVPEFPGAAIAGLGCAFFLLFYAGIFVGPRTSGGHLALALALSVSALVLLKTAGATFNIALEGWGKLAGIIPCVLALPLLWDLFSQSTPDAAPAEILGFGPITGICLGHGSIIGLLYFAFTSPAAMCRWADAAYPAVIAAPALGVIVLVGVARPLSRIRLEAANAIFVVALTLATALYSPEFNTWQQLSLYLALTFSPVLFVDFALLSGRLFTADVTCRKIGAGFTIAMIYLAGMILATVFTTTYEYVPRVGFLFRDSLWALVLVAGAVAIAHVPRATAHWADKWSLLPATLMAVAAFWAAMAPSPLQPSSAKKLTAVTYNIQQGFDSAGRPNHRRLLRALREIDADIIALQESDTCRISSGNVDVVRFLAEKLRFHSYFGPKTVTGTFGIALLSRYPIESARTHFMSSKGEQTATIEAEVNVGFKTISVLATHFGEYEIDHIRQAETVVELTRDRPNVVLLGDFNIIPGSHSYHYITRHLQDAWVAAGNPGEGCTWEGPQARIDYIFASKDLIVRSCRVRSDIRASDHMPVVAVIDW